MKSMKLAVAIGAALCAASATAAELEYGVEVGAGHSDNIRRVPTGETGESMLTTGVDLAWLREEGRLHADVDLDLSYMDYQDNAYDGEVTGMAQADFRMLFVPQRFEWVLTDSFGQSEVNPFSASTPDNRENVNYFTTGPDLSFRLGSAGAMTLFARFSATDFEDSDFDDQRKMGGLSFGRDLSERSSLSFNVTTERVEFDDALTGSDYDRQSAFLRYDIEGARTTIGAEAGYTQIHDNGTTSSSPLVELDITRQLSERTSLTFRGGVRSSDAASALRAGNELPSGGGQGRPGQVSTTDPFETRHASVGWQFAGPRTGFLLSAGYEDDQYENDTLFDRERTSYVASVNRQVTPRFSVRLEGSLHSTEFDSGVDDDEVQFGLHLSWNATGRLYIEPEIERFDRNASDPLSEFEETRYFLRFAWRNTGGGGAR